MLINYEVLETSTMDELYRMPSRRVPSAAPSSTSGTVSRPCTSSSAERVSSAMSRSQGPASRVYKNMQRQIYKLWYDKAIPPAKALAYLRGRSANVMFTVSGQPVQIGSTSANLQNHIQPKTPDVNDAGKNGLPDVKTSATRAQTTDISSVPSMRTSFRESPKKNLLSPSYYAASNRDGQVRRPVNTQPEPANTQNGLMISAQSMSASPNRSSSLENGHERSLTVVGIDHGDHRLERSDEDEVDGYIPNPSRRSHDKGSRKSVGSLYGSDADHFAEASLICNSVQIQRANLEENAAPRSTTANLSSFNRRTRPFSSFTTPSAKSNTRSHGDPMPEYPDPFSGGPALFQQRLIDLSSLENETLRWERLKASKRKSRLNRQD